MKIGERLIVLPLDMPQIGTKIHEFMRIIHEGTFVLRGAAVEHVGFHPIIMPTALLCLIIPARLTLYFRTRLSMIDNTRFSLII